jgi:hypothetical protein
MLPPMHELAKVAGLELPEFLGRARGNAEEGATAPKQTDGKTEEKK